MITDQGCQTNAPTSQFFVSSEPEVWVNDVFYDDPIDALCADYQSFYKKLSKCAGLAGFNRLRVYGEIRQDGEHCMVLVTELKEFKDNAAFWHELEAVVSETEAHLWIMDDSTETERSRTYGGDGIIGEWIEGPNHGKAFYQVELSWRIETLTYNQIEALLATITEATERVWRAAGVGVC